MPRHMDTEAEADSLIVTTVRLPSDLKHDLARLASVNKRTLSSEIVKRLSDSVSGEVSKRATQLRNHVVHHPGAGVDDGNGNQFGGRDNPYEQALLILFAQLSPERQLALLTLLRGG